MSGGLPNPRVEPRWRTAPGQCVLAVLVSGLALAAYHAAFFVDFQSSDGANYATVARNLLEGRGLKSSVIQPGLMTLVPTSRAGQAYVTQRPLWPVLLAGWFRLFGAAPHSAVMLSYVLCLAAAAGGWWLAYRLTGTPVAGHLATALLLSNPHYVSNVIAVYNVALHSALVTAVFLAMWARPTWPRAVLVGVLLALAVATREPSIFMLPGLAYSWMLAERPAGEALSPRVLMRRAAYVAVATAVVAAGLALQRHWVVRASGTSGSPTLHATFLYYTPVLDANWYFVYDDPAMKIDPGQYFARHPDVLLRKVAFQLWVSLVQQTLLVMQSMTPLFVPLLLPWLLADERARRRAWSLLIVLAVLVAAGSVTTLHLQYFLAFFPAIQAVVAAVVVAFARRWLAARESGSSPVRAWVLAAGIAYALLPIPVNVAPYLFGRRMSTGEYGLTREQIRVLSSFIAANTAADAVVVCSHSPLMAWHTRRVILQYSGSPAYRISDSPMWQRIDAHVPIDAIVLNSWAGESPDMEVLAGFRLTKSLARPEVRAWLFERDAAAAP